jgi:hypothetical protein
MASPVSLAIACDEACERIEEWAAVHVAEGLTPLPRAHRDREILRKIQLETIADWLDRAVVAPEAPAKTPSAKRKPASKS